MLKRRLIFLGTLAACCAAAYALLLTDDARKNLSAACGSVSKDVRSILEEMGMSGRGACTEGSAELNKQRIIERWERMGL
ncbi:hypothetical protein [Olsenella urininfantis]|uniref:hypothetical protein n=1 Tax=Olsenella urininfantis TaxID=1871033 RepID=UPI00098553BB|nr:hypothetical protein [Olsenella urininfantis]